MSNPTGHRLLEPEKYGLVSVDHLSRIARYTTTYDDGSEGVTQHVLYWGGTIVQSMRDSEWLAQRGALPPVPTPQESAAAVQALAQADQQAQADAAQLRQQIINLAQSAVGVRVDALSATQVRALFAVVLWQEGALKNDMTVRPLTEWVR